MHTASRLSTLVKSNKYHHPVRITGEKTCNSCFKPKPIIEYSVNRTCKDGRRTDCKSCQSIREVNRALAKRAEKNPQNYMECNNCDRPFSRYTAGQSGHKRTTGEYAVPKKCIYCNSINIEPYVLGQINEQ